MHFYLLPLSEIFQLNTNTDIAFYMKKYMKGQYEYFGIKSPERREIKKEFLQKYGLPEQLILPVLVKDCWELPQREFQYFIMEVLERTAKKAEPNRMELYEFMIMNKSWWDTVDYIASNLVGVHFKQYPELISPTTKKWMDSGNIWLQRTSLLFQLKYKRKTDVALMSDYIKRLQGSKEFFINKAIGWALRQYSRIDEQGVREFVAATPLQPLSAREALKWLEKRAAKTAKEDEQGEE
jgi:3-methyladenine DNA glycosylase AlkD